MRPPAAPPPPPQPPPAHVYATAPAQVRDPAGFGHRVAAYLFDAGIALAAGVAAGAVARDEAWESPFFLTALATWLLVTAGASLRWRGQTLGKRLVGTRVVQSFSGAPAAFGTTLLRDQFARLLWAIPLFFLIDSIWAAASPERQTLRDKMCSTHVVRETARTPRTWAVALAAAALLAVWVAGTGALGEGMTDEPGEGYSDVDRRLFVDTCSSEGGDRRYCVCLYESIAERVSYDDYVEANRSEDPDDWPKPMQDAMVVAVRGCGG